jgi:hypothetical protein
MGLFGIFLLIAALAPAARNAGPDVTSSNQAIRIPTGEYKWWPLHVRKAPSEIDCRFEVLHGDATVHAELLHEYDFRQFVRHRPYEKITETPAGSRASFSQLVPDRGDYAVVIINKAGAPPAIISMFIEAKVSPEGGRIARTLAPARRLAVILISFAIFFVSAGWSGHRLIRAMKNAGS